MNVSRRGLLGMFAAGAAAAIVTPGVLMPIKPRLVVRAPYNPDVYAEFLRARAEAMAAQRGVRYERLETSYPVVDYLLPREGDTVTLNGQEYTFTTQPQAMRWRRPNDQLLTIIPNLPGGRPVG